MTFLNFLLSLILIKVIVYSMGLYAMRKGIIKVMKYENEKKISTVILILICCRPFFKTLRI